MTVGVRAARRRVPVDARAQQLALTTNVAASKANASPAPTAEDERGAQRGSDQHGQVLGRLGQRAGVLDYASEIVCGSRPE